MLQPINHLIYFDGKGIFAIKHVDNINLWKLALFLIASNNWKLLKLKSAQKMQRLGY